MTRQNKNKKINNLRKFFNADKPHCQKCGSLLVKVTDLTGKIVSDGVCYSCN